MNSSPAGAQSSSMTPRLLKGTQADYELAPDFPGFNPSGLLPLGPNVLVRIDTCSRSTAGGVMLADDMIERMDMASESGVIYAIGKTAWRGYTEDERPQLGDRVYFQRFSGLTGNGGDGAKYRIMDESCIACILDPEAQDQSRPSAVGLG